jgi:sugar lactone lactonase YvrE
VCSSDLITPSGVVTTLAGTASITGSVDGAGALARFSRPEGIAVDQDGYVYVADTENNTIRKITPSGIVTTLAGTAGVVGIADGIGAAAQFYRPAAVAVDADGNLYVADTGFVSFRGDFSAAFTIRKVTPGGAVTTLAGTPYSGVPFEPPPLSSADGTGSTARFSLPSGLAVDGAGYVYVADSGNDTIRRITPDGVVTTLAGVAGETGDANGNGAAARFNNPTGIAVDGKGNLYVVDTGNNTIRVGAFNAAPSMPTEPAFSSVLGPQTVSNGATVVFNGSTSSMPSSTYQWYFGGTPIAGATQPTLVVYHATPVNQGFYDCVATNALGVATGTASLILVDTTDPGRLINLSCRSHVGAGADVLIVGFVVGGNGTSGSESLLVRASGPALIPFDVTGVLPDPDLRITSSTTYSVIATNNGWGGDALVSNAAAAVGAFPWTDSSSHDSALLETLPAGPYTAVTAGFNGDSGIALAEIYDATPTGTYSPTTPRLINISARAQVGQGANELIAGFVIGGTTSKTVLIRASGPALTPFGVSGVLPDPQLQLNDSSGVIATNMGWGGDAQLAATSASVGAFSWGSSSTPDSAILVTLPPGAYTAMVSGASGDTGIALVEVYEVQ